MKKFNRLMIILFICGLGIDQFTKFLISHNMHLMDSIDVIPGFFSIMYVQNKGAAWSMLEGKINFFYIVAIFALIVMLGFYKHQQNKTIRLSLVLMMSGTVGNLIDRIAFKHVVDFLSFNIFGYDFPVFNVADIMLVVGVIIIFINEMFGEYIYGRKIIKSQSRK